MTIKGAELVVVKNVVNPPPEMQPQEMDVKRRHPIRLPRDRGKTCQRIPFAGTFRSRDDPCG
jgi:hypothetical protein